MLQTLCVDAETISMEQKSVYAPMTILFWQKGRENMVSINKVLIVKNTDKSNKGKMAKN